MTVDKDKLRQIAEQCAMPYPADSIQFKTICLLADNENKPMSAAFIAEFLEQDNKAAHNALRYPVNHGNLIREKDGDFWKYSLPKEPRKLSTKTATPTSVEQSAKAKPKVEPKPVKHYPNEIPRDPRDIKSDPEGKLINTPEEPLIAYREAQPLSDAEMCAHEIEHPFKEITTSPPQTCSNQQEVGAHPSEVSDFAAQWCSKSGFSVSKAGATVRLDENDLDTLLRLYVHMRGGLPSLSIVETSP